MPCPLMVQQVLLLYIEMRFLWAMPALRDPSTNCSCIALHPETYCVKGCEDFSSFVCSASSHPTLPLTSLFLARLPSVPAGSALSPAALCRGAAPGQSCLSAVLPTCCELPPSQESGTAWQQRTSPRHFNDPSGGFGAESMNLRHWEEVEETSQEVKVRCQLRSFLES